MLSTLPLAAMRTPVMLVADAFVLPPPLPTPNHALLTRSHRRTHFNTEVFKFKFKPQVHLSLLYLYESKKCLSATRVVGLVPTGGLEWRVTT